MTDNCFTLRVFSRVVAMNRSKRSRAAVKPQNARITSAAAPIPRIMSMNGRVA